MTLKRTTRICALLSLAAGCLNLFGQPTSPVPVTTSSNAIAAALPVTGDLDNVPPHTIASLIREWKVGGPKSNDVVHVRGAILDQRLGEYLVIRDDTGTILAESSQTLAVKMQTVVDVWGTGNGNLNRLYLQHATFRVAAQDNGATNGLASQKPANLPVLTKAMQVRELSSVQAGWEYPVKLRGVVTLTYQQTRLYVEDDTAGIFIRSRLVRTNLKSGDLVEIEGNRVSLGRVREGAPCTAGWT